ncbi:hypothetical protein NMY22_g13353 [Coprinellus aureogranulatus]|nr:hypothetical protein NMY22_g13353 [Coprinellus aureogranulatus]
MASTISRCAFEKNEWMDLARAYYAQHYKSLPAEEYAQHAQVWKEYAEKQKTINEKNRVKKGKALGSYIKKLAKQQVKMGESVARYTKNEIQIVTLITSNNEIARQAATIVTTDANLTKFIDANDNALADMINHFTDVIYCIGSKLVKPETLTADVLAGLLLPDRVKAKLSEPLPDLAAFEAVKSKLTESRKMALAAAFPGKASAHSAEDLFAGVAPSNAPATSGISNPPNAAAKPSQRPLAKSTPHPSSKQNQDPPSNATAPVTKPLGKATTKVAGSASNTSTQGAASSKTRAPVAGPSNRREDTPVTGEPMSGIEDADEGECTGASARGDSDDEERVDTKLEKKVKEDPDKARAESRKWFNNLFQKATGIVEKRLYGSNTLAKLIQHELTLVWPADHKYIPGCQQWGPNRFPRAYNTQIMEALRGGKPMADARLVDWGKAYSALDKKDKRFLEIPLVQDPEGNVLRIVADEPNTATRFATDIITANDGGAPRSWPVQQRAKHRHAQRKAFGNLVSLPGQGPGGVHANLVLIRRLEAGEDLDPPAGDAVPPGPAPPPVQDLPVSETARNAALGPAPIKSEPRQQSLAPSPDAQPEAEHHRQLPNADRRASNRSPHNNHRRERRQQEDESPYNRYEHDAYASQYRSDRYRRSNNREYSPGPYRNPSRSRSPARRHYREHSRVPQRSRRDRSGSRGHHSHSPDRPRYARSPSRTHNHHGRGDPSGHAAYSRDRDHGRDWDRDRDHDRDRYIRH